MESDKGGVEILTFMANCKINLKILSRLLSKECIRRDKLNSQFIVFDFARGRVVIIQISNQ